jgi:hypothetical protein
MKQDGTQHWRGRRYAGTRRAVEAAIGITKRDRSSSWEVLASEQVGPWSGCEWIRREQPDQEAGKAAPAGQAAAALRGDQPAVRRLE